MKQSHVGLKKKNLTALGIATGVVAALLLSAVMTAVQSNLVSKEMIGMESKGVFAFVIRIISVFIGGILGTALSGGKNLQTIGLIAGGYFVLLLGIGVLLFDGSVRDLFSGLISTLLGGVLACAVRLKPQRKRNKTLLRMK